MAVTNESDMKTLLRLIRRSHVPAHIAREKAVFRQCYTEAVNGDKDAALVCWGACAALGAVPVLTPLPILV